jgi:hypothetical protein
MKTPIILLLALLSFSMACSRSDEAASNQATSATYNTKSEADPRAKTAAAEQAINQTVTLNEVDKANNIAAAAIDRKIIRNAEMTLEVTSTRDAQHQVTSIIEANGGFVASSDAKQREHSDPAQRMIDIKLVTRVPSTQFQTAFDQIQKLSTNTPEENVSSQDVTEDFIDLEARIKTQKALELQFLEIMRQARNVEDALEVQRQIAEVRTDIEKLEGRKRFLENRSSLSTITVNLQTPKPVIVISKTGFGQSLQEAVSDSISFGSELVLFFIRFGIMMIPVGIFVLLPAGLVIRYLMRRSKRMRLAESLAQPST